MQKVLRIGTRDSQLAVWQASLVKDLLQEAGVASELVYMKSEGDVDTVTPLYALGVTGVFTKTLDAALLNNRIDIAVHSMKDVPVQLAQGIRQAAVLKRGSHKDILVLHPDLMDRKADIVEQRVSLSTQGPVTKDSSWSAPLRENPDIPGEFEKVTVATGSIRRIAQWLNKYPNDKIENLRGNVNTRLRKLKESQWHGAIFAAAGLERIHLRPENSVELHWMLPAPAQGAIMVVCRENDAIAFDCCQSFHHEETALCTTIERAFLSALLGGCSTPISALATISGSNIHFHGNIVSPDGKQLVDADVNFPIEKASEIATVAANSILSGGGREIIERLRKNGLTDNGEA